jgi:hypothetical protein
MNKNLIMSINFELIVAKFDKLLFDQVSFYRLHIESFTEHANKSSGQEMVIFN